MFHIFQRVLSYVFLHKSNFPIDFFLTLCNRMCDVTAEVFILVQFPCKGLRACLGTVSIMKLFDRLDHYSSIIYFYVLIFSNKCSTLFCFTKFVIVSSRVFR